MDGMEAAWQAVKPRMTASARADSGTRWSPRSVYFIRWAGIV